MKPEGLWFPVLRRFLLEALAAALSPRVTNWSRVLNVSHGSKHAIELLKPELGHLEGNLRYLVNGGLGLNRSRGLSRGGLHGGSLCLGSL